MKVRVLPVIGLLLLSACNGQRTLVEKMTIHGLDAGKTMLVVQAAEHVMVRRLAAVSVKGAIATVIPTGTDTATLTLKLPDSAAVDKAKVILTDPFTFDLRLEEPKAQTGTGDLKTSDWIPTALTGSNLEWVEVIGNSQTGVVGIELQFTPQGRDILATVFKGHIGKHLGIFVRDLLVSKLVIQNTPVSDHVVISGIPSAKVAEIFADDVNVGLKVTFTPL